MSHAINTTLWILDVILGALAAVLHARRGYIDREPSRFVRAALWLVITVGILVGLATGRLS